MDIDAIRSLAAEDMAAVNRLIQARLSSDVVLINQLGSYIVNSGGKRLRPLIVLLAARANGYRGEDHIQLAAVIEFIHTATLLHDDVVDASELRRGQNTANSIWGNEASVLVGDFLYSRAFEMMVEVGKMEIMAVMAGATNTIAEGEVMQLLNIHEPDITEAHYLDVIYRKTGTLFEAGCRLGGMISNASSEVIDQMAAYGKHLGNAFQLIDDALDYDGDVEEIGKNIGDDLAEGKPTMPLLYAIRTGSPADADMLREVVRTGGRDRIKEVHETIEKTGAIAYTRRLAKLEADRAKESLGCLPNSDYRQALERLADFSVERTA
ncbi:octaprenyl diphosphate synthase [Alkalilimnicola ehrlichii]|uniref:Octaprenyl diphosphate synthase n=1 Tax=Alkalilimnicola ehrlichii TaxID=351052 RepID=A0A3E0X0H0_9GAMM|nr:octaprenyl diphosphate synthase [Alkalilimnicola ehrlichii]RFA30337.1 octaprenyl diphosphate synthase [Alkalilimnicola ehrlichii]RFA37911.1 octaprenyl diphosphate synthase [Alkalilimnicola ehrlichii]